MFYGEQFTTKEISRLLQMNESTIRSKLHRGIPYFQRGVQRWEEFLAVHSPAEDSVPASRPYVESGGSGEYVLRVPASSVCNFVIM